MIQWAGIAATLLYACAMLTACQSALHVELESDAVAKEQHRQRRLVVRRDAEADTRLLTVSYPLLVAAAPICGGRTGGRLGVRLSNLSDWSAEFRQAAADELELDDRVTVTSAAPDSSAAAAGLIPGDRLVSVNGFDVGAGEQGLAFGRWMLEHALSGEPLVIGVQRADSTSVLEVLPDWACNLRVGAYRASGSHRQSRDLDIPVSPGLLGTVASDADLTVLLAHEIVHVGLSESSEEEADYLGLHVVALAGLPVDGATEAWRNIARQYPNVRWRGFAATHPPTPTRLVAIEKTVAEIQSKLTAGESLHPTGIRLPSIPAPRLPNFMVLTKAQSLPLRSGEFAVIPAGCWRAAGVVQNGAVYLPAEEFAVHGHQAALVIREEWLVGIWMLQVNRFARFEDPVPLNEVASPSRTCGSDTAAGTP